MDERGAHDTDICPHFVPGMRSCGLYTEGFYMPLRRHVAEFCMSRRHRECSLYTSRSEPGKGGPRPEEETSPRSRRGHERIPQEKSVTLCACDEHGNPVDGFFETAATVDLSRAGMRVKTSQKLPPGTPLVYEFHDDFFIPGLRGMALVCWQREAPGGSPGIEAGLLFYDNSSRALLSRELTG